MTILLFFLLFAVIYVQLGYAGIMWLLARTFPQKLSATLPMPDAITIVICAHNGAERIQQRLQNLASCDWAGEREYIVFCDGCSDNTSSLATQAGVESVRVLISPEQRGKWAALNDSVKAAKHPIVVFADLRQTFDTQAIQKLVQTFRDPNVGAVSGLLEIAVSNAGGGQGVDLYWRIERKLREWEARFDSVIGCTGAIYAIRRDLFTDLPQGTILDDVVVPMRIAMQGHRIAYEPAALAFDPQTLDPDKEMERKLRTLVGNYQMIEQHPDWLLPWRNRLWCQLISHKYARLAVPWLMATIAAITLLIPKTPIVWLVLAAQLVCYSLGLLGSVAGEIRSRLVSIPAGFLLLQWSCARALFAYLRTRRDPLSLWKPSATVLRS